jgi:hypothetical protein
MVKVVVRRDKTVQELTGQSLFQIVKGYRHGEVTALMHAGERDLFAALLLRGSWNWK